MKTITLRTLVREPLKVKRMTRAGKPVQVTDNGHPLWVIQPAVTQDDEVQRRREIEAQIRVEAIRIVDREHYLLWKEILIGLQHH